MRSIWLFALLALLVPVQAGAGEEPGKKLDMDKKILSAADVQKYLTPYEAKIGACYKQHASHHATSTGDLKLELIVHRDGSIFRIHVAAAGLKGKELKPLSDCITALSKEWSFPPRSGFTHVLIPFFYLKTEAKGAGPLESCWNPRGCPKKRRAQREKIRGKKDSKAPAKKADSKDSKGKAK